MKKADSSIPSREMPEGLQEETLPGIASYPNFPPPVLRLEGHAGDYRVSLDGWSYTVMRAVTDMYIKHAQKKKRPAELTLYDTGGLSWEPSQWTILYRSSIAPR